MFLRKTLLVVATSLACLGSLWADELPLRGSPSEAIQFVLFQPGQAPQVRPLTPDEQQRLAEARAAAAAEAERTSTENLPSSVTLIMQGDPLNSAGLPPARGFGNGTGGFPPEPRTNSAILVPSIRGFKIAEGESPRPLDRVYFNFNYFDEVNKATNEHQGVLLHDLRAYRETFGFEKTFFDGDASIGFRLPLNTLSADSDFPGLGGTSTDLGDLSTILKYAFWSDQDTGNLLSAGLAITAPTGPNTFASFKHIESPHNTTFQPFVGGIYHLDRWYVHGFSSIDVPAGSPDVTFLYNDVGVSYLLFIDRSDDRIVTALAPTFEAHLNTPLNHRGALRLDDPVGSPDVLDLTFGTTVEVLRDASFRLGFVVPVTGPRPFDYELQVQFTWVYGRRR